MVHIIWTISYGFESLGEYWEVSFTNLVQQFSPSCARNDYLHLYLKSVCEMISVLIPYRRSFKCFFSFSECLSWVTLDDFLAKVLFLAGGNYLLLNTVIDCMLQTVYHIQFIVKCS